MTSKANFFRGERDPCENPKNLQKIQFSLNRGGQLQLACVVRPPTWKTFIKGRLLIEDLRYFPFLIN